MKATYTTRLLEPVTNLPKRQRWAAAASVASIVICAVVLSVVAAARSAPPRPANANASRIIIVATASLAPTMRPPTATPAPAPEVRELPSGAIVAWNGHTWSVLREAPTLAPAVIVEQVQPAPVIQQVTYQDAPVMLDQAPLPEVQPEPTGGFYDLSTLPTAAPEIVEACKHSSAVWCQ